MKEYALKKKHGEYLNTFIYLFSGSLQDFFMTSHSWQGLLTELSSQKTSHDEFVRGKATKHACKYSGH